MLLKPFPAGVILSLFAAHLFLSKADNNATFIPSGATIRWSINEHNTHVATLVLPSLPNFPMLVDEDTTDAKSLLAFVISHKDEILARYNNNGLVLLRDFPFADSNEAERVFNKLTDSRPGTIEGPLGFLPGWLQTAAQDLVLAVMLRFLDGKRSGGLSALAPASRNVQGPHQEGQLFRWRWPQVGFFVESAPASLGETVLYHAHAAFQALPPALQSKVSGTHYSYHMHLNGLYDYMPTWMYDLTLKVGTGMMNNEATWVPMVLKSPVSNESSLQFFGFGKTINEVAADAFNNAYPGRNAVSCNDYFGEYFIRPATSKLPVEKFTQEEEVAILKAFMESSFMLRWKTNDFALVDNIRWAHGRANGDNSPRVLHFYQSQPMIDVFSLT